MKLLTVKEVKESLFGCYDENTGKIEVGKGGHVYCKNCFSRAGVKTRNYFYYKNNKIQHSRMSITCVSCGTKEIRNNWTGEILRQEQNMVLSEYWKLDFSGYMKLLTERKIK